MNAAGKGGNIEMPHACIRYTWLRNAARAALARRGRGLETSDTSASAAGPNAVNVTFTRGNGLLQVGLQPTTWVFQGTITINVDGRTSI